MMKNYLTQPPFLARTARAAEAGHAPAAERLYRLVARLPQTGNFLPFKRPSVTDA
jgi:hypothetical protein